MFKQSKTNNGELWAEKIAAEIGLLLDLNMMHVQFAKKDNTYGVIMENFVPRGHELQDGGGLLSKSISGFKVDCLDFYTIDNIMNEVAYFGMEQQFVQLCLFDALIASSDRHCENWGVIHNKGTYTFAPIYDNGDSLGFNVTDEKLSIYETDANSFNAFTNRTKTLIEVNGKKKPKLKALLNYLLDNYENLVIREIDHFKVLDYNEILAITNKIPLEIMSIEQKKWVNRLIKYRHEWLIDYKWREC